MFHSRNKILTFEVSTSSASRGRVYLPQDELAQFALSDKDVFSKRVTDKWKEFMKEQITRARFFFNLAEEGASQLDKASRWPVSPKDLNLNNHNNYYMSILILLRVIRIRVKFCVF